MAEQSYVLKLDGMAVPSGEIEFRDLVDLADSLQLTATRVGRQIGRVEGPGRTPHGIDDASSLRMRGLQSGSTGIDFVLGNAESFPDVTDELQIKERFEEIVAGIASNHPPEWVTPLVAKAAERVAVSLVATGAKYFSFASTGPHARLITPEPIAVGTLDSTVWKIEPEVTTSTLTVAGTLEAVDLRANRFRIRDDIGNDIRLDDVADLEAAARLIGTRVVATGMAERDDRNRVRLVEPVVVAEALPANWIEIPIATGGTGGRIPEQAVAGVSDEEIEAFLAEIRS